MSSDEYLDVVAFVPRGREQKMTPVRCGYAKRKSDTELTIYMDSVPAGAWDGRLVVQPKREQRGGGGVPRTFSAQQPRHAEAPPMDDYGPGGNDDLPF